MRCQKYYFFGRCFAKKVYQMHIIPTVLTIRKYALFTKLKGCKNCNKRRIKAEKINLNFICQNISRDERLIK